MIEPGEAKTDWGYETNLPTEEPVNLTFMWFGKSRSSAGESIVQRLSTK